jgi:cyclase
MRKIRIIPRLDIKGPNLIKGVHLEGLRVLGDPALFAKKYYKEHADELIYIDSVASLYERNNILEIVKETAKEIFIPLTVGGGIRSVSDARAALLNGADKVAINTAAIKVPALITAIAEDFGSQCVVVSIEAKRTGENAWECYIDNGREKTGIPVLEWVKQIQDLGAGEILLTSVDQEGTKKGFDISLVSKVMEIAKIPVIASGGMGTLAHLAELIAKTDINAIAIANVLHYGTYTLKDIREELSKHNIEVRC